ncbi:MAG: PH domain-containing protein [Rothia sp. (in: high G+C Gram-positive bacteria)]|nr:PH domain-containing protein [Rothia sp. (in: high G+C Gram-positive bacteria)]
MKSQYVQNPPVTFRAKTAPWYTGCALLLAASVLIALTVSGGVSALATRGWALAFFAYAVWYVLGRSRLVVGEKELTVINPFVTHTVNYAALIDISTRYHLTLVTPEKKYQAFGIPASGMVAGLRARPEDLDRLPAITHGGAEGVRTSDLPNSLAGSVALVVRGYWQEQVEDDALTGITPAQSSKLDGAGLAIFAALLLAAIIGLMV